MKEANQTMKKKRVKKNSRDTPSRNYEKISEHLLGVFKEHFELSNVSGPQVLIGKSGTKWNTDADATSSSSGERIIIECRRYPGRKINQAQAATLAFTIQDTNAGGAIFVSPLGLQKGASRVSQNSKIRSIRISADSTIYNYFVKHDNKNFIGLIDRLKTTDTIEASIVREKCNNNQHNDCESESCSCFCHKSS